MGVSLLSNPPYNISWTPPALAGLISMYAGYPIPPANNANYAFILAALDKIDETAALILPNSVLTPKGAEKEILKKIIDENLLSAVVQLPGDMFASTSIPVCVLRFNRKRQTKKIYFCDLTEHCVQETREQRGQFGGASHTGRVYKKTFNVISPETIQHVLDTFNAFQDEKGFCRFAQPQEIAENDYSISPKTYVERETKEQTHRPLADIAADYNRVVRQKNAVHIKFNETAAKRLGLLFLKDVEIPPVRSSIEFTAGVPVEKENYVSFTKSDGITIACSTKESIPGFVLQFVQTWKARLEFLNEEENRLLAEFRDAVLPELMSGRIDLTDWKDPEPGRADRADAHDDTSRKA